VIEDEVVNTEDTLLDLAPEDDVRVTCCRMSCRIHMVIDTRYVGHTVTKCL